VSQKQTNKEKIEEQLLRKVSETTSGLTGEDFITELPKRITNMLGMRYCFIAECADEDKSLLHTIVFVEGEQVLENFKYNANDSACKMVITGQPYFLPKGVHLQFKGAKGIEAYIGVPIISPTTGKILGHIAATDTKPVTEEKNQTDILKIFASRIGAEMERMNAQKELQKRNDELRERIKENEFYHFTIENLREAVVWVNDEGYIWQANSKAAELSGYSKEELLNLHVSALNKSFKGTGWTDKWKTLENERKVVYEAPMEKKDGSTIDVEVTQNYIEFEGKAYTCSIIRDIHKRKMEEELLRTVSENTAALTGSDYFVELAKFVTSSLNVRFAMVCRWANEEKTKLTMLAYVDRHKTLEGFEYETEGTPCQLVMKGNEFFCGEHLHIKYPREENVQSWVAVPIYSPTTHEPIGNIGAFDYLRMTSEQNQTAILRIFAARAGAEMERMDAQRDLERANQELARRLKEIELLKNQLAAENKYLQEEIKLTYNFDEIVSRSRNFKKVLQHIEQVACTDATVLILGESGTGKELLARAVHNISNRCKKPLVKVNCAALPVSLIESELFGHERGAFTGALERKIGRFELANGGSIFLDEIGELPIDLQSKLLRVLQEGEFERLGNPVTIKVNVRVIAATNRNLEQAIEKKEFREDLYYRLNVFPINCPPLRERTEDIPLLVKHFCQKYESKIGKKILHIPLKVMNALTEYNWPGNIRELENIIERALILSRGSTLEYGDWLPKEKKTNGKLSKQKLQDVEREHIIETLKQTGWKVSGEKGAAKILGLNATTLEARMKKLGIRREA
jgi:PAS domain S-box-containing protein